MKKPTAQVTPDLLKKTNSYFYNYFIAGIISLVVLSIGGGSTEYINGEHGWTSSKLPLILGIIISVVYMTEVHAFHDAYQFEVEKIKPGTHFWRALIIIALCFGTGCLIHFSHGGSRPFQGAALCTSFIGSIYYATFDYLLNWHRGRELTYITKDSEGSISDRIFSSLPDSSEAAVQLCFKLIFLGVSCTVYLIYLADKR